MRIRNQFIDNGLLIIQRTMESNIDLTVRLLHGIDRNHFQAVMNRSHEGIGDADDLVGTAEIVRHVIDCRSVFRYQSLHMARIGAAEFIDVLVIITDSLYFPDFG